MRRFLSSFWIPLIILLAASLACSIFSQAAPNAGTAPTVSGQNNPLPPPTQPALAPAAPTQPQSAGKKNYEFPLPEDAANINDTSGMINFQTKMNLKNTLAFYRKELQAKGLTERKITTVVSETMFSIVFDGSPNGKALVVQGVALGESTNVNIRYEDV